MKHLSLHEQLEVGRLHQSTYSYQRKLEQSRTTIFRFLDGYCSKPYVALSWGKQSIVVAHLVYSILPDVPMFFMASWESDLLHNYKQVEEEFTSKYPIKYQRVLKDNVSGNSFKWKETRDIGNKDLQTYINDAYPEWDGVLMGLVKEESFARRLTLSVNNTADRDIFLYTNGKHRCCPLSNWDEKDLAAYISTYDLPLLDAYHRNGLFTRTTARITRNNAEMNGMADLKARNITAYNKIVRRFPELGGYS